MTLRSPLPHVKAAVLDAEQDAWLFLVCPMCHTSTSLTPGAVDAGADCRCAKCGERWDAIRLLTVAAYTAKVLEGAAVAAEGGGRAPMSHSVRIEPLGGKT